MQLWNHNNHTTGKVLQYVRLFLITDLFAPCALSPPVPYGCEVCVISFLSSCQFPLVVHRALGPKRGRTGHLAYRACALWAVQYWGPFGALKMHWNSLKRLKNRLCGGSATFLRRFETLLGPLWATTPGPNRGLSPPITKCSLFLALSG